MKEKNIPLLISAWSFLVYSLIEITDVVSALLMSLGLMKSPYPEFYFAPLQRLFSTEPLFLLGLFIPITALRLTAAIGLFKRREWGYWTGIGILAVTFIWSPFLLPLSIIDFLACSFILICMIMAKTGSKAINQQ